MQRRFALKLVAAMYLASLVLVGFRPRINANEYGVLYLSECRGYEILFSGWLGVFDGTIAWFANPLLFLAVKNLDKRVERSMRLSAVGFVVALSAFFYTKTWIDEPISPYADVGPLGLGFYLWLSCFGVVFLAAKKAHDEGTSESQSELSARPAPRRLAAEQLSAFVDTPARVAGSLR